MFHVKLMSEMYNILVTTLAINKEPLKIIVVLLNLSFNSTKKHWSIIKLII